MASRPAAVKVSVHGATGRLGALIVTEAGTDYVGPVERGGAVPACDVVIDVSSAAGTAALLPRLTGQALVVGSTGELPMDALRAYAQHAAVAVVPNFSVGIPLLLDLVQRAVGALPPGWDIEIVEAHHHHKLDSPSGTAKRLARAVGRPDVPTHSLRVGDTFGEHTVWLCGPGERIELKHVATRREVFAIGAMRWARALVVAGPGLQQP
jgi:4-hydroxy-tetrahydrodipicolinate reductase